jgi:hypothetical protein
MKTNRRPAKRRIIVALLGMCTVASSYSIAHGEKSPAIQTTAAVQSHANSPHDPLCFWPYYYCYSYNWYGYYYYYWYSY